MQTCELKKSLNCSLLKENFNSKLGQQELEKAGKSEFLVMLFLCLPEQKVNVSVNFLIYFCEIIQKRFLTEHLLSIASDCFLFRQYVLPSLPLPFPNGLPKWIYGEQNHFSIVYQLFLSRSLVKRMDVWFFCNILFYLDFWTPGVSLKSPIK